MSGWAYYFLAKVYLHLRGHIPFDVVANLAFAAWLMLPTPASWAKVRAVVWGRRLFDTTAALLLAWHDSWLPPLSSAVGFLRDTPLPSPAFLTQLVWRNVATVEVAALAAIVGLAVVIRRRVRLTPVVLVLLAVVAIRAYGGGPDGVDGVLASFYAREAEQTVTFPSQPGEPFDVVLVHVCSLSWDDLTTAGLEHDSFMDQFNMLFTRFNSVTAHSNPSAIRLLRSGCGQSPHDALYRPARDGCYLADALQASGYRIDVAFNHDGAYDGFADQVKQLGHVPEPLVPGGAAVRQLDFTGAPVFDDYEVLADWWARRRGNPTARTMLYYNTVTLHDGGRLVGDGDGWKGQPPAVYGRFVRGLFEDLERFFRLLEADGGRVAVIMVAEHGVALRGSRVQPAGLREVPLPQITTVPMGVKLIGPGWFRGEPPAQQVVGRPTSYLAIATLLAHLLSREALAFDDAALSVIADQVPSTDFVAETEGAIVVQQGERYLAKGRSSGMRWVDLSPDTVGASPDSQTARR